MDQDNPMQQWEYCTLLQYKDGGAFISGSGASATIANESIEATLNKLGEDG